MRRFPERKRIREAAAIRIGDFNVGAADVDTDPRFDLRYLGHRSNGRLTMKSSWTSSRQSLATKCQTQFRRERVGCNTQLHASIVGIQSLNCLWRVAGLPDDLRLENVPQ